MNSFTIIAYPPNSTKIDVGVECSFTIEAKDQEDAIAIFDKAYLELFGVEGLILDIFNDGKIGD